MRIFRLFSYLFGSAPFEQKLKDFTEEAVRTMWSRSGRDPSSNERVAGAQSFFPRKWMRACMRPYSFSYLRTTFFKICFYFARSTKPKSKSSNERQKQPHAESMLLPPADYTNTPLPPRGSSRQHHARLAGPRCAMPVSYTHLTLPTIYSV